MVRLLIVMAAGAFGCGARFLVAQAFGTRSFPYATLAVNLVGSLLIALILETSLRVSSFSPNLRLALTTGFMGGFTTYSSFNYEATTMATGMKDLPARPATAGVYVAITLIGCILCGLFGTWLARRLTP